MRWWQESRRTLAPTNLSITSAKTPSQTTAKGLSSRATTVKEPSCQRDSRCICAVATRTTRGSKTQRSRTSSMRERLLLSSPGCIRSTKVTLRSARRRSGSKRCPSSIRNHGTPLGCMLSTGRRRRSLWPKASSLVLAQTSSKQHTRTRQSASGQSSPHVACAAASFEAKSWRCT